MKVLVIGATGKTGHFIVNLLLQRGHNVTAFVRQASAIQQRDRLRVVEGDARDSRALDRAVKGQDAVVSAFGPGGLGKTDLQEIFMLNLVKAMESNGVKRLVNLSVWGSGGAAVPASSVIARYFWVPVVLRNVLADKRRGETYLFASDLDYTNVCPAMLKDSPARGGVHASQDGAGLKQVMHREDLAAFMVEELSSSRWVRRCVVVGY